MIIKEAIELQLKDNEKIYDVFLINQPYDEKKMKLNFIILIYSI